jgi:selenium donor protein
MLANNEIGTVQPLGDIAEIGHKYGSLVHTDAAQAVGKIPVDVRELGVDLLSIAGHKLYAPKGIGALFVRKGTKIEGIMQGAGHERGLRPGTENVLLSVGLGKACEVSSQKLTSSSAKMGRLRDRLEKGLLERLGSDSIRINGGTAERLPNTSSISFGHIDAGVILAEIGHRVAASAGAACHADVVDVSPVLKALGLPEDWARGTVRFSVGRETTKDEIDEAVELVAEVVQRVRSQSHATEIMFDAGVSSAEAVKLTRFTKGMGCACKIRPQQLESILRAFPQPADKRILVDMADSDDAAVYEISKDLLLVQTVDFLTPIVDDPFEFGMVAAANSLSDIYAMGATPAFALNLVAFPSSRLPLSALAEILRGATEKCREAGVAILGGHSIEDPEPKFGLVVTGTVERSAMWRNGGAQRGDVLILTKPLGTGLIATGVKQGVVSAIDAEVVSKQMSTLNRAAAESLKGFPVHACTDVTGFGFLGHACEMMAASGVAAEVVASRVPMFAQARALVRGGIVPSGTRANLAFVEGQVEFEDDVDSVDRTVLSDAQTSGGLLVAVSSAMAESALNSLHAAGVVESSIVGSIVHGPAGRITVTG